MSKHTTTEEKRSKVYTIIPLSIFMLTVSAMAGTSYLYGKTTADILRNSVLSAITSGTLIFLMAYSYWKDSYAYDNKEHYGRFFLCYISCLAGALISPLLPVTGWPYAAVFLTLSLFSNTLIGIVAGSGMLMMSVLLVGADSGIFALYFACGLAVACLFADMNESYKIGLPVTISMMVLILCQTSAVMIYANEHWTYELFIIPVISLFVNIIVMFIMLKCFSHMVVQKDTLRYIAINDQEYELLVALKKVSSKEYYRAVHTVHFCERIADKLKLDTQTAKTGGYYHRIGLLKGENSYANIKAICEEHAFPPKACRILKEYSDTATPLMSKEAAVLFLSDKIISSIMKLFEDGSKTIDYNRLIDAVFEDTREKGLLSQNSLTMAELTQIKEIFKKEQLYYDFLR